MVLGIVIFLVAYALIVSEKMDKTIPSMLGAAAMVIFGVAGFPELLTKIDLNVLGLLIGMMVIVNIMSTTGAFEWVAVKIARQTRGNGVLVMLEFMVATAVISAFMDNVTTIILMAPVTILITQLLSLPTVPFLILEAIFSNIGGTATLIGDPPNILIGSSIGLSFMDFVYHLTPVVAATMVVLLVMFDLIWGRRMTTSDEYKAAVMEMKAADCIVDRGLLYKSLFVLACVIAAFVSAKQIKLDNGTIALVGAAVLLLLYSWKFKGEDRDAKVQEVFGLVDWTTIFFFTGLFVIVYGLEETGVLRALGNWFLELTGGSLTAMTYLILWSSAILSSVIDNIPFVATMIPMIKSMEESVGGREAMMPVWWALSLGACFGGNGTLIGASANVVVAGMAMREGHPIKFLGFLIWSVPVMLLSVGIATVFLYLEYQM